MFTGIVTAIGTVRQVRDRGDWHLTIACESPLDDVDLGASIACSGVCLTVVGKGEDWFSVDVSNETRRVTAPEHWEVGARLNLERALRLGDELGGHLVTGHVDAVGEVLEKVSAGDSTTLGIGIPRSLGMFVAPKGSVTIDGVSLTVNVIRDECDTTQFSVNLIPYTGDHTTLGLLGQGDKVNIEIDLVARYLKRLADSRQM
jgi:riboflavin synthase